MKKLITIILILAMLLPAAACADLPDISGLSFDELVQLRDQLNLAIWNSQEWKEVTVPIGVWKIGEDIPAGKWTIKAASDDPYANPYVIYCDKIDESGAKARVDGEVFFGVVIGTETSEDDSNPKSVDLECHDGRYIVIQYGPAIFSPFAGKQDLGF